MANLLDMTLAALLAGSILLMSFVTINRNQSTSWEAKQHLASKVGLLAVIEIVENDFANIGSGMAIPNNAIVSLDTTSTTKSFQFYSRTNIAFADSQLVNFEWSEVGTATVFNGTTIADIPVYQITRYIDGVLRGNSIATIKEISIELRDETGTTVSSANYPLAREIEVHVEIVSPLGPSKVIPQNSWTKVFRPIKLNPANTIS